MRVENFVRTSRLSEDERFPVRQWMAETLETEELAVSWERMADFLFSKNLVDYVISYSWIDCIK